ncbi:DNA topoisomerase 2-beta [Lamellibrachia satsuma]|nr:DNA topoisomerase 2-beta [Lamellibrachia satsuma]
MNGTKMKAAKKKKPVFEDDSGDDYIPGAEVTAKKATKPKKKKPVFEDDSGDDYIPGAEVTAKKAPKPKKKKPVFEDDSGDDYFPDVEDVLSGGAGDAGGGGKKKLSVERIYQKKTQLEHILLRPDTYIGSVEKVSQPMWVFDDELDQMVQRDITFVPGLYKIFDEILVNASDNKQRDKNMSCIKVDIIPEQNKIKIWNNGKGIPVVMHKGEQMFVPTMIFGHLLTSSNFDDTEKKVTGGRNGYGAKLCNVFSTKFVVETQCSEFGKSFCQSWSNNMSNAGEPKIGQSKGEDYTAISFYPDLAKFGMETLDKDIVDLFKRRAYDIAACSRGVRIFLNGKKLPVKNFREYVAMYVKGKMDEADQPLKVVSEAVNERWEVALALSDKGFQQVSFVNSIATTKGGRHVDYISDQLTSKLIEVVKKKEKKSGLQIKPFQVRQHMWVFVNCLIENPTFDSQTKENMTLQAKSFGSKCQLTEKFILQASKCGVVESVLTWMRFKAQEKMNKKCASTKHSKLKGIPKLDDANNAGTRNSLDCTLILTEGDSAKSLAIAGLSVIGRDHYGVFPLRGKVLNVREASHKQIMENAEINNMIKIIGLRYKEKYTTIESLKTLRYGRIMIMTDQDQDGSHIKGLLINFFHHNWPQLLQQNFVEEFITPIIKVTKNKVEKSFYSLPEFEEWKQQTDNWHTWRVKYYKGLGTSTSKEAKEYFSDMARHRVPFKYAGAEDDASIVLAFSKKKIEERKQWLTNWMEERKRRAQLALPELYLYGKDVKHISYNEFVNRELILFSNMDNERSIPSLVDGFKPGQRKVLFACFKRNLVKEVKVAQLAGSVAELSAYHHGEQSLMGTIVNLAQNFVGSNNVNLLQPRGQFGTRLHGGRDAASPRYIFTLLSTLARHLFSVHDDPVLKYMSDDNQRIEPEWYIPIIPMVLVNGAEGIGTGWSTKIPNYNPREIVANIKRMLDGNDPEPMLPWFKNFHGTIQYVDDQRYVVYGEVAILDEQTIEITELPIRTWTQTYKENVLEPMLQGTDKVPATITDYKEYHTDTTVKFVIQMSKEALRKAETEGLHKVFKLQTLLSINSMVLFDGNGCIKRYANVSEIFHEFYTLRLEYYQHRKDYMEGILTAESLKLENQARFICEKVDGVIVIENKRKKEMIQTLVQRGYDSDPIKAWKESQEKLETDSQEDTQASDESETQSGPDYNYLLNMMLWYLTKEKKDELLKQRDAKAKELAKLRKMMPPDLWREDLEGFLEQLDIVEQQQRDDERLIISQTTKTAKGRAKPRKQILSEVAPSDCATRIVPQVDSAILARVKASNAAKKKKALKESESADSLFTMIDDNTEDGDLKGEETMSLFSRIKGIKSETVIPKAKPKKRVIDISEDEDVFGSSPIKKTSKPKKFQVYSSDEDDDDVKFSDFSPPASQQDISGGGDADFFGTKTKAKPVAAKKKAAPKAKATSKALPKGSPKKKSRKAAFSDSDDDIEFSPVKPAGKRKKANDSDSDDDFAIDDDSITSSQPSRITGRSRAPVKYNFGESDSDEMF